MDSVKNRRKNSAMKRKYHDNPEPQEEYNKRKYNKKTLNQQKYQGKKHKENKTFLIKLKDSISK